MTSTRAEWSKRVLVAEENWVRVTTRNEKKGRFSPTAAFTLATPLDVAGDGVLQHQRVPGLQRRYIAGEAVGGDLQPLAQRRFVFRKAGEASARRGRRVRPRRRSHPAPQGAPPASRRSSRAGARGVNPAWGRGRRQWAASGEAGTVSALCLDAASLLRAHAAVNALPATTLPFFSSLCSPVFDPPEACRTFLGDARVPTLTAGRRAEGGSRVQAKRPLMRLSTAARSTTAGGGACHRVRPVSRDASLFALDPAWTRRLSHGRRDAGRHVV